MRNSKIYGERGGKGGKRNRIKCFESCFDQIKHTHRNLNMIARVIHKLDAVDWLGLVRECVY